MAQTLEKITCPNCKYSLWVYPFVLYICPVCNQTLLTINKVVYYNIYVENFIPGNLRLADEWHDRKTELNKAAKTISNDEMLLRISVLEEQGARRMTNAELMRLELLYNEREGKDIEEIEILVSKYPKPKEPEFTFTGFIYTLLGLVVLAVVVIAFLGECTEILAITP